MTGVQTCALPISLDLSCVHDGWRSPENYEHLCYTDITPLYGARGFADGVLPYLQHTPDGQYLEYPVLTGAFMQTSSWITTLAAHVIDGANRASVFFHVNVLGLFLAFLVTVIATIMAFIVTSPSPQLSSHH